MKKINRFILISFGAVTFVLGMRAFKGVPPALIIEPQKIKGNVNATTSIVVFSDFGCGYCQEVNPIMEQLLKIFPNELKIIYKHFPLKMHPPAHGAAEASECAADQNKFWEFHDILFNDVEGWYHSPDPKKTYLSYASQLTLDLPRFELCLDQGDKKSAIEKNKSEARRYSVSGTPTLLLNGNKALVKRGFTYIKNLVEEDINRKK